MKKLETAAKGLKRLEKRENISFKEPEKIIEFVKDNPTTENIENLYKLAFKTGYTESITRSWRGINRESHRNLLNLIRCIPFGFQTESIYTLVCKLYDMEVLEYIENENVRLLAIEEHQRGKKNI